jgi:hypothetical protein
MDTTTFLSAIWGPVLLAAGLGFFFSRPFYVKVYRDLEKAPFAVIFFGMIAMAAGIAQILVHDLWGSFSEALVSLLGWGLLIKGIVCTTFPKFADRGGNWVLSEKMIPIIGGIAILLGLYLSWVGYFM